MRILYGLSSGTVTMDTVPSLPLTLNLPLRLYCHRGLLARRKKHVPDNFVIHHLRGFVFQYCALEFINRIRPTGCVIDRPVHIVFGAPLTNSDMYSVGRNSEVMSPSLSPVPISPGVWSLG